LHNTQSNERERAILVGLSNGSVDRWVVEDYLDELTLLAETAGAEVVERIIQERRRIDPAYFIGRGKAEWIAEKAKLLNVDLLIFDDDLSPAQVKNWERLTNRKILDRSGLILDIFARRAKTREAKTQVELAQLNYLLPRLTRQWTHLSRQVGGIGTRGPGETQLEVDRRMIRKRISVLSHELEKLHSQRSIRRQHRTDVFKVALVGYTNVGKSTLLNVLSDSQVFVENQLFATLDPTVRSVKFSKQPKIVLIDTVGFIRKLPHHLVASFKSTLEEAADADMLLHIVDISHPQFREQMVTVREVLHQLGIAGRPTVTVFNKVDRLQERALIARLRKEVSPSVFVSAQKGIFLEDLKQIICQYAAADIVEMDVELGLADAGAVARMYELAQVTETRYSEDRIKVHLRAPRANVGKIERVVAMHGDHGASPTGSAPA
jgi:GTP-binding protein HflX